MAAAADSWTVLALVRWATEYFTAKGVAEPRASAEILLAHVLNLTRLELYLRYDQPLAPAELAAFKAMVVRRRAGEPVAYLTGHKEFWSLDFLVTPSVLIPRPETEILVAAVLEAAQEIAGTEIGRGGLGPTAPAFTENSPKLSPPTPYGEDGGAGFKPAPTGDGERSLSLKQGPPPVITKNQKRKTKNHLLRGLEIGVGSGAVVVALAKELPNSFWVGVDLSPAALLVARENARRHQVAARVDFLQGDLLRPLKLNKHFDLLVANLPYVPEGEWRELPKDLKDFEPPEALKGGADGLDLLRSLVREAPDYLAPGGWLALEIGAGQAEAVKGLIAATEAFESVSAIPDYQGIPRVVRARRKPD